MYIIKVMKRKDASSVLVAIWLAMSLMQLTSIPTYRLSNWISGWGAHNWNGLYGGGAPGSDWRSEYLSPVVSFLVQVIVFEILIRLFILVHPVFVRKKK